MSQNREKDLQLQVKTCIEENKSLSIVGGNSKSFYGNSITAETIKISGHSGIINYQPSELVITARAGTPLSEINEILAKNNQRLPFEPPKYGENATLGGTIACGFSGSARPFNGSARDAVLGCKIINGHGEILHFGGEVVKNVAGYDVSRLMTGALGTLGILLEISIKVLPVTPKQLTFTQEIQTEKLNETLNKLRRSTLPLSGVSFLENTLYIRLNGTENSLDSAKKILGTNILENDVSFWNDINEHTHDFFQQEKNLWQIFLPPATEYQPLIENSLIDWAGGLYWHFSDESPSEIRKLTKKLNGHAILFRQNEKNTIQENIFSPLHADMLFFHKNIKNSFDPKNIFNPGKMYKEI